MGEVTVSAKDKKKSKNDRDKRSEVRTGSDKDKEALERAIKQSQKEDRRRAKEEAKEEREMAKALEESRLASERQARKLKILSSTPAVPTPLHTLERRGLVVCDVFGNMNISSSSNISLATPIAQAIALEKSAERQNKKKSHSLHTTPLDRSSESKDSGAHHALEEKGTISAHTLEFKDSSVNLLKQKPLSLLPVNESKSDPESEVNLFTFPDPGDASCARNSTDLPLPPPARMNSSSSDHEHQDIKCEPPEGLNARLDPNDEFDLRNGILRSDISDCLPSLSGSETRMKQPDRKVITEEDVLSFKEKAHC
jgi:hypothetical protein